MSERRRAESLIGMVLFLGSWSMLFIALLFSLGIVRAGSPAWPPAAVASVPAGLPAAITALALASTALLVWGRRGGAAPVFAAAALGAALVAVHVRLGVSLAGAGAGAETSDHAIVWVLFGFHAAHATVGTLGLAGAAAVCGWRRRRGAAEGSSVALWSLFWYVLVAAWLAIGASVFVL